MKLRQFILLLIVIIIYSIGGWFIIQWSKEVVTKFDHVALLCALILAVSVVFAFFMSITEFIILLYDGKLLPKDHWLNKKLW
jgi:hypothetical protein